MFYPWRQRHSDDVKMKRGEKNAQRGNELMKRLKQILVMVKKKKKSL